MQLILSQRGQSLLELEQDFSISIHRVRLLQSLCCLCQKFNMWNLYVPFPELLASIFWHAWIQGKIYELLGGFSILPSLEDAKVGGNRMILTTSWTTHSRFGGLQAAAGQSLADATSIIRQKWLWISWDDIVNASLSPWLSACRFLIDPSWLFESSP